MKFIILIALMMTTITANAADTLGRIVGQLGMSEGEVLVENKIVKKNSPVREGDTIEVKKGKATLLLGTGSVFHLSENSKMIVNQFGVHEGSTKEGGNVDLRFGRTRALILNKGDETKDIKIKTRSATMGVRGTEVFVDVPKDESKPVQMFTMEGSAIVEFPKAPAVPVKQNEGVSSSTNSAKSSPAGMSVSAVKNEIKNSGMTVSSINSSNDMRKVAGEYGDLALKPGDIPAPKFDPIVDRLSPLVITPHYVNSAP